jgi:hypothetical protein
VVGFVGRVPRFRSVAVDCVTRSVFFFAGLLVIFFVGSIGSDSIQNAGITGYEFPVAWLYGYNLVRDRALGGSTASFARGRVLGPGLRARVLEIRAAADGSTAMALHLMRGGELGIFGLLPPGAVGHGGAQFCCFDAIFVATRGMAVWVISSLGGRSEDFSSAVVPFALEETCFFCNHRAVSVMVSLFIVLSVLFIVLPVLVVGWFDLVLLSVCCLNVWPPPLDEIQYWMRPFWPHCISHSVVLCNHAEHHSGLIFMRTSMMQCNVPHH